MVTIPSDYGYVMMSIAATWIANIYLMKQVMKARERLGVKYPLLYAEGDSANAREFNCVQRGHQNMLETWAPVTTLMLLSGLHFPCSAAVLGVVWTAARIIYANGYATGKPNGQETGSILAHLAELPLLTMTAIAGWKFVTN